MAAAPVPSIALPKATHAADAKAQLIVTEEYLAQKMLCEATHAKIKAENDAVEARMTARAKFWAEVDKGAAEWRAGKADREARMKERLARLEETKLNNKRTLKLMTIAFNKENLVKQLFSIEERMEKYKALKICNPFCDTKVLANYYETRHANGDYLVESREMKDNYNYYWLREGPLRRFMPLIEWHKRFMILLPDMIAAALKPARVARLLDEHGFDVLDNM